MSTTWVIAADKSCARIFQAGPGHHLEELEDMVNPAGRMSDRELGSDAKGSHPNSGTRAQVGHTEEHDVGPAAMATERYIKSLGQFIDKAHAEHRFDRLRLIAPPKVLGLIRASISEHTRGAVKEEFPNEIAHLAPREIEEFIKQHSKVPGL